MNQWHDDPIHLSLGQIVALVGLEKRTFLWAIARRDQAGGRGRRAATSDSGRCRGVRPAPLPLVRSAA